MCYNRAFFNNYLPKEGIYTICKLYINNYAIK